MYVCILYPFFIFYAICRRTQGNVVSNAVGVGEFDGSGSLVKQTIEKYFHYGGRLGLVLSRHVEVENIFKPLSIPVVLFTTDHLETVDCRIQSLNLEGYILVASCNSSLENQTLLALNCFNLSSLRLKSKRILIVDVCIDRYLHSSTRYLSYLEYLWKSLGLIYVAMLPICKTPKGNMTDTRIIFTYNPFKTGNSLHSYLVKAEVDKDFIYSFKQRFRNMNGYKMKAVDWRSTITEKFKLNGTKVVRETIQSYFNLTLKVVDFGPEISYKNASSSTLVKFISDNQIDLTLHTIIGNYNESELQYLSAKMVDSTVVVIINPPISVWEIILYAFTIELWIWIGFSYTLICVCATIFFQYQTSRDRSRMMSVLSVCNALLTKPIIKLPARNSERLFLGLCLWLGFIITTILLGQIIRFMYSSPQPSAINTFYELNNSGIKNYSFSMKEVIDILKNHSHVKLDVSICSDGRKKAIFMFDSIAKSYISAHSIKGVHIMKEKVHLDLVRRSIPAGSIMLEHFDRLLSRLHQSGIVEWMTKGDDGRMQSLVRSGEFPLFGSCFTGTDIPLAKVMSYEDLKVAFYSLYVGLALSAVCFMIEIMTRKLHIHDMLSGLLKVRSNKQQ